MNFNNNQAIVIRTSVQPRIVSFVKGF